MNRSTGDIETVTYLKPRAADLLKQIDDTYRLVSITQNGQPKAVAQDSQGLEKMRNAIGILKMISVAEEEITNGKGQVQADVFKTIEARIP
jgi:PHD/YefM family antitoxin component YafN of YafNO toxin-antitoxin module